MQNTVSEFECKKVLFDRDVAAAATDANDTNHASFGIATSLKLRRIKIGSYIYDDPKKKVRMTSQEIKIIVPSLKNEARKVTLLIPSNEIDKIIYASKGLPVIFVYITKKCAASIRKALHMTDESGPYIDVSSKIEGNRRITLLPYCISEECQSILKKLSD